MGFAAKRRIGAIVAKTNALPVPLPVPADNYPCSSANAPCSDLKGIVAPARPLIHATDAWRQDFDMTAAGPSPIRPRLSRGRGARPARSRRPTRSPPPGRRRARGHRGRSHPCRACGCSLRSLADLQRLVGAADTVEGVSTALEGAERTRNSTAAHSLSGRLPGIPYLEPTVGPIRLNPRAATRRARHPFQAAEVRRPSDRRRQALSRGASRRAGLWERLAGRLAGAPSRRG